MGYLFGPEIATAIEEWEAVASLFLSPMCAVNGTRVGYTVWTLGNGDARVYPFGRVPAHPLSVLGLKAMGNILGEPIVCKYHIRRPISAIPT